MKALYTIVALVAIGCVTFFFWKNYTETLTDNAAAPAAAVEPVATPAPQPVSVVAAAAPTPQQNLAPKGTYFLLQRVSITTDSGVTGVLPGTKVTLVSAGPPMRVTDGQEEFDVTPAQVTNDLDVASRAFYSDQAMQTAIKEIRAQQAQEYSQQQQSLQQQEQQQQLAAAKRRQQEQQQASAQWQNPLSQGAQPAVRPDWGTQYAGSIH